MLTDYLKVYHIFVGTLHILACISHKIICTQGYHFLFTNRIAKTPKPRTFILYCASASILLVIFNFTLQLLDPSKDCISL